MFDTLVASRARRQLGAGDISVSAVVHAVLLTAAVYVTANTTPVAERISEELVTFAEVVTEEVKPPEPEPQHAPPPDVAMEVLPAKGFQVLTAPVSVPDVLPAIDLTKAITDEADFSGKGVAGGIARGVVGGAVLQNAPEQAYFEFQVEKAVIAAPNNVAPKYPEILREGGVAGSVLAQFVVDTLGRADLATFKALQSSHELFTMAIRNALPSMRFYPAEVGGRKVKQLVQQPFEFTIHK